MFLCVFRENMSDKLEPPARLARETKDRSDPRFLLYEEAGAAGGNTGHAV